MAAASSYFPSLLEAGVRIFRYQRGFVHAKTLVVDDWVSAVGSANLDMRSFHLNFELNAFVYGKEFADAMAAQFLRDLERAQETGLEHERGLSTVARVVRAGARLLSPLL
jgi:cardiolipin synthase